MKSTQKKVLTEFTSRLETLYAEVTLWIADRSLKVVSSVVELHEEILGRYEVASLSLIKDDGKQIGIMTPVGASVIGASGRVDLVGAVDREILVFLDKGGPTISRTVQVEEQIETQTVPLYRGVSGEGWYWIENRKPSRARLLDKTLFLDLLDEVSDYESR